MTFNHHNIKELEKRVGNSIASQTTNIRGKYHLAYRISNREANPNKDTDKR